ncbi:hypothetical protein [Halorubellus litoreus]|uniref:Uncharacterized protein n=1 Tax=Halorubellus litoreus TaxID=755308 RepID=A0ABD5VJI6_9EURY
MAVDVDHTAVRRRTIGLVADVVVLVRGELVEQATACVQERVVVAGCVSLGELEVDGVGGGADVDVAEGLAELSPSTLDVLVFANDVFAVSQSR